MTYQIKEIKNDTFKIAKVESIAHLTNLAAGLEVHGKEASIYHMERIIEGTRKKPQTIMCYRFKNTGNFITMM
jgi:hypothetical protein